MPLSAGERLGPYEVLAQIGAGGMGEVYRARDTKLDREVAIKVLPAAVANHPERLARFEREAKVLAALNHPHIAAIYGLEDRAIVMELVEGPTLADRIASGAIPIEEALKIAAQIAEALEAAHEKGIVHRDLKPANIKVSPDGIVKVLDLGLATALPGADRESGDAVNSPTLTMGGTEIGIILGTAAYMSPEQASGKRVDKRADIWSFGVVLWEMLAGQRLFDGAETVSHTLADVLRAEIDFGRLPASTPAPIRELLHRCLDRDVKTRLRDIGEARVLIQRWLSNPVEAAPPPRSGRESRWGWMVAAGLAVAAAVAFWAPWRTEPLPEVIRFQIPQPDKATFGPAAPPVISPDGRKVAFIANPGVSQVWVRSLDTLEARPLPGTEGAAATIFWSPDSRSIAFWTTVPNTLKRVEVAGGPPQTLCSGISFPPGGAWSPGNVIVFYNQGLFRVPAAGGDCTPLTSLDTARGETAHRFPSFLPDGRHFVYLRESGRADNAGIYVGSLDDTPAQQSSKRVLASDDRAIYVSPPGSKTGYLLFRREGTLMAQGFDAGRLELMGDAAPVAEQVGWGNAHAGGLFSASATGAIAYRTGSAGGAGNLRLTWFDRQGRVAGAAAEPITIATFPVAYSPDGTQAAFTRSDGGNQDLWLHEFARGTSTRFTSDPALDLAPVWSPDGKLIVFATDRGGGRNLYRKASSNTVDEELLFKSNEPKTPTDWSRDARFLLFDNQSAKTGRDIFVLTDPGGAPGNMKATPYLNTPFNEDQARFSPDGRFVAYSSDSSGRFEVYVQTFPDPKGGRWQVSQDGGQYPHWRRDGKELLYLAPGGIARMMSVEVSLTPQFKALIPKVLFQVPFGTNPFDVTADGQRFIKLISASATSDAPPVPITVVVNWTAGLKK